MDLEYVDLVFKNEICLKELFDQLYKSKCFHKLGLDDNQLNSIKKNFTDKAGKEIQLSQKDGMQWFEQAKVPESLRTLYWRSVTRGVGSLDFYRYVIGICASNLKTPHEGLWRRIRNHYIFSSFDTNGKNELDAVEFRVLVHSIRLVQNKVHIFTLFFYFFILIIFYNSLLIQEIFKKQHKKQHMELEVKKDQLCLFMIG